jgi:GNAT superfamily N-acetyltransferase
MPSTVVRKGTKRDAEGFLGLVDALAHFEDLEPPSESGKRRLVNDVFVTKKVNLLVATDGKRHVGYALYFYTYSSFLAKPSLYLEDLFVLEEYRGKGIGFGLFRKCVDIAAAEGCGRMEWAVLTWNTKAIEFYEKLGAKRMDDWHVYRLDEGALRSIPRKMPKAW